MRYYLAPLEGITTYIYRNAVCEYFGDGIDKYFTPFFGPDTKRSRDSRDIQGILPEHNPGQHLVPQILTLDADDYFKFEKDIKEYGYKEADINFGCPSGTVTGKGRGSGALLHPGDIDRFLYEVYSKTDIKVSVKTRIGWADPAEWPAILDVYNRYPVSELIVHPRVKTEMYKGAIHKDVYRWTEAHTDIPLCLSGDVKSVSDAAWLAGSGTAAVMVGRGMVADPSLIRQLAGGEPASRQELKDFMNKLLNDYIGLYPAEQPVLFKMKEIWSYMGSMYPGREKQVKQIFKAKTVTEYRSAVAAVL